MDDSIFTYLGGAVMAALGFHLKRAQHQTDEGIKEMLKKDEETKKEVSEVQKELAMHKLHVSENYAKNTSLAELRVEQIESTKRIWEGISDIQTDIKTLIREVKK